MKRFFNKQTRAIAFLAIILTQLPVFAFSGGQGTEAAPYLITDAYELAEVKNNLSAYYRLENDIDLTDWIADNNPSQGWVPIAGSGTSYFSGDFDGNGKTIKGLFINRSITKNVCLNTEMSAAKTAYRIASGASASDNIAWVQTKVSVNGTEQTVSDNTNNGTSYGMTTLQRKATYTGLGTHPPLRRFPAHDR